MSHANEIFDLIAPLTVTLRHTGHPLVQTGYRFVYGRGVHPFLLHEIKKCGHGATHEWDIRISMFKKIVDGFGVQLTPFTSRYAVLSDRNCTGI